MRQFFGWYLYSQHDYVIQDSGIFHIEKETVNRAMPFIKSESHMTIRLWFHTHLVTYTMDALFVINDTNSGGSYSFVLDIVRINSFPSFFFIESTVD